MVPAVVSEPVTTVIPLWEGHIVPLRGPIHEVVANNEGRGPVEHLAAESPPGVENRIVRGTGEGVLSVWTEAVGDDSLLRPGA